jgi:ABC-type dipeptide/oligopeptide/nickel transport system ATPase component
LILEIKNLNVDFRDPKNPSAKPLRMLEDFSLRIQENSFTTLVGESGAGKSLAALAVCGLVARAEVSGQIYFFSGAFKGKNLLTLSRQELVSLRGREISYIFQDPGASLNPVKRVGDQIKETYQAHFEVSSPEALGRAKSALESAQIKDVERVYQSFPHQLSGGMKQRAMIAMALISSPKLLIADEPTAALDTKTALEIMKLLGGLQKEKNLTIFFITHDLPLACEFSQTIYVAQKGRLVESMLKKPDGFAPQEPYSRRLFNAQIRPFAPKTLMEV